MPPHSSDTDRLTGLLNLKGLRAALAQSTGDATLLVADIYRFRELGDWYSIPSCDQALRQTAERVRDTFPDAVAARIGGDEFAALLSDVRNEHNACEAAERLRDALQQPIHLRGDTVVLRVSVGYALTRKTDDALDSAWEALLTDRAAGTGPALRRLASGPGPEWTPRS